MSKSNPTMSHTKSQRKAWHAGKRKSGELVSNWMNRVLNKGRNNAGAYTPAFMKRGITYMPL